VAFNLSKESDFIQACAEGNEKKVKELLAISPKLTEKNASNGSTPLMFATSAGSLEAVELLLKNKADVNALSPKGETALWFATRDQRWLLVGKLLAAGAKNVDASPVEGVDRGVTALWFAAVNEQWSFVDKLLAAGAKNVDASPVEGDNRGATALWWATVDEQWPLVDKLLAAGTRNIDASPIEGGNRGTTALWWAALHEQWPLVDKLLAAGAKNVDAGPIEGVDRGTTALWFAAVNEQWPLVCKLLAAGAKNVDASPVEGVDRGTPVLWFAALHKQWLLVDKLLAAGAKNVDASPVEGVDRGTPVLWFAALHKQWLLVDKLLAAGAKNIDATPAEGERRGKTALWWAVLHKQWPLVKKLITLGANVNIDPPSKISGGAEGALVANLKKTLVEERAALVAQQAREETRYRRQQAAVGAQAPATRASDVNSFPIKANEQEGHIIKVSRELRSLANEKKALQKTIRDNVSDNIQLLRRPLSGRQNKSRKTLLEKNIKYLTELQKYLSTISECGGRLEQPVEGLSDLMKVLKGIASPYQTLNLKYNLERGEIAFSLSQFVDLCNRLQDPPSIFPHSLNSGEFITLCERFKTKLTSGQAFVMKEILEGLGKAMADIDQNLGTLKRMLNELKALSERVEKCKQEECAKFTVVEREDGTINQDAVFEVIKYANAGTEALSKQEVEERKIKEERTSARNNAQEKRASWLRAECLLLKIEPPVKKASIPKVRVASVVGKAPPPIEVEAPLLQIATNRRRGPAVAKSFSSEELKYQNDVEEGTAVPLLSRQEKHLQRQRAYQELRKTEEDSWHRTNEIALLNSRRAFDEAQALAGRGPDRSLNVLIANAEKKTTLELSTLLKAELTRLEIVIAAVPTVAPWSLCQRQALLGSFACFNEALSKENLNMVSLVAKRLRNALFKCSYALTEARYSSTTLLTMVKKWIGILQSEDARGIINEGALLMKIGFLPLNELFGLGKNLDVVSAKNHWEEVNATINVSVSVDEVKRCSEALKNLDTEESIIVAQSAEDFTWACLSSHLVGLYEAGRAGNKKAMSAFREFNELKDFLLEIRDKGAIARHSSFDTSLVLSLLSLGIEGLESPSLVFSTPARVEVMSSQPQCRLLL
jgi:ankyrin repeat protein